MSLSKGVPMLAAGITEGKNDINARIRYFNYGIDLRTEKPKPEKIRMKAGEILRNGTYKNNTSRIQSILGQYNPNKIIEELVTNGG